MRYIRWTILTLFFLSAACLLVWGPRPAASRPKDRVVVQYWEKWTGQEGAQMQEIVSDFNATVGREKGIYVEILSQSNVNQKTLIATAAGVPPDVAGVWDGQVAQFAAVGALEPLDDLARQYGIGEGSYKKVYWDACKYQGKLYALISTPASVGLHWNKRIFLEKADKLRAAGCDPLRAPRTLEELDRYAAALTERDAKGRIVTLGYVPMEPGWYISQTVFWFGGQLYDEKTDRFQLTSPESVRALEWVQGYSRKLGKDALTDFRSGLGNFASTQNPFLTGQIAMVQQGPWMANFIELLNPGMNRWQRPASAPPDPAATPRTEHCEWAVAPFPSVYTENLTDPDALIDQAVTWCGFDVLTIPQGARHKKEAFEFIAYVNRMEVMEKLCSLHCKNTPLARHSENWQKNHPNPYVDVFDRMASSPHAYTVSPVPIWPEVGEELGAMFQRVALLEQEPRAALEEAQTRLQAKLDQFRKRHESPAPSAEKNP